MYLLKRKPQFPPSQYLECYLGGLVHLGFLESLYLLCHQLAQQVLPLEDQADLFHHVPQEIHLSQGDHVLLSAQLYPKFRKKAVTFTVPLTLIMPYK